MLPSPPDWPWYTYAALVIVFLFMAGFWLALLLGIVRGCVSVLSSTWRGLTCACQWAFGLPLTSSGSAHFATRSELLQAGLLGDAGLPLAAYGQDKILREPHGGHIVIFGPPRSWKSSGIIMPSLLDFPGSCVVNDLRGELYEQTHEAREAYGPTYRFAPTSTDSCAVNILDLVRWGSVYQFGDVHRIVNHLLSPPERQAVPNPFADAAMPVLTSIVTHCYDKGCASFPSIVQWMLEPTHSLKDKVDELLTSPNPLVTSGARRLSDMSERLRASVWNAALVPLSVFEDPTIARHTGHSDVRFTDLLAGLEATTLYLCPSFQDVRRLAGFLGAFVEALVAVLGSPERPPRHPVLLCLDEMANLGYLPELEKAISYLQGSGTQVLAAFQNIAQVRTTYGPESPLLASFSTQVQYRPNDEATAAHIAGLLGQATVLRRSNSAEVGVLGLWSKSRSESETERPLLTIDEILRLGQTQAIIVQSGCPPVLCRKQGTPAPTPTTHVRHFVAQHRQPCAIAAGILLVLASLWPALQPLTQHPAPLVQASRETQAPEPGLGILHGTVFATPPIVAADPPTPPAPQTPYEAPVQSPVQTPYEAPVQSPVQAILSRRDPAPAPPPPGTWVLLSQTLRGPLARPRPTLQGTYASEGHCQTAMEDKYGAHMTQLERLTMHGKNLAVLVQRHTNRWHWEEGFAPYRNVNEAWCTQQE